MEVGSYTELVTYFFGLTLVYGIMSEKALDVGNDEQALSVDTTVAGVGVQVDQTVVAEDQVLTWGDFAAYTIIIMMTAFAIWCFKMGIEDEMLARNAEKVAVAHILFREMDADGSSKLDRDEVKALCERLGHVKTDAEITAALKEMDKDGSMEAEADEFVDWWVNVSHTCNLRHNMIPGHFWNMLLVITGRW